MSVINSQKLSTIEPVEKFWANVKMHLKYYNS